MGKKTKKPGKGKEKTAKADEKRARRETKKLSPEDDIDAILEEAKKKEVHVEDNVPALSPRSNCMLNINPLKETELILFGVFLYGGYSKEVSSHKTGSEKGVVHSDLWSLDPRAWEWNKAIQSWLEARTDLVG
ncbi:PREDICTED: kelch [Prunus dulcis]|uniref:PREDICTED: kelch n=1 Tax=Prunus dulcis TaxID=3755 RepID=A0A5E4EUV9_PRUDU|nr:PREDICTED: kelch [Prunus dulcis]